MAGTLEHLTNEAPRWHPSQIPQQHQLAKLACGRVAALLRASPKRPSSSPFRGNSFPLLAISLCHHPELVFTGEGRNLDWPVTQQCHFHTWVPCCKEMCHRQVALIGADRLRLIATCWWSVCICKVVTVICKCSPICLAWLQTVWVGPQLLWDRLCPTRQAVQIDLWSKGVTATSCNLSQTKDKKKFSAITRLPPRHWKVWLHDYGKYLVTTGESWLRLEHVEMSSWALFQCIVPHLPVPLQHRR